MAARRVASTAVDWVKFADKIPAAQQTAFAAFKNKHSEYLKAVNALPEAAPKIDFAAYANKIAVSGLVEELQKKYESLEIPYPKESLTATVSLRPSFIYSKYIYVTLSHLEVRGRKLFGKSYAADMINNCPISQSHFGLHKY